MASTDDQFDDFKTPGDSPYVNETIGKVFEQELTEVEQFKDELDEQLMMADSPQDELTEMIIGYIQGAGDVNQVNICSYRAKNGVGIDAWGFNGDEDLTTIDLFLTLYIDPEENHKISANDLDRHFNWLNRFYDQSKAGTIFSKIEEDRSDLYQVAQLIKETLIRFEKTDDSVRSKISEYCGRLGTHLKGLRSNRHSLKRGVIVKDLEEISDFMLRQVESVKNNSN